MHTFSVISSSLVVKIPMLLSVSRKPLEVNTYFLINEWIFLTFFPVMYLVPLFSGSVPSHELKHSSMKTGNLFSKNHALYLSCCLCAVTSCLAVQQAQCWLVCPACAQTCTKSKPAFQNTINSSSANHLS